MKGSKQFKQTIKEYLDDQASSDALFKPVYEKAGKSIDDCIQYILNTVKATGCEGFKDDEVYSMAIHYYQEDDIDIGKAIDMDVVVNHKVQLTEEEKADAKEQALKEAIADERANIRSGPKAPVVVQEEQQSLF